MQIIYGNSHSSILKGFNDGVFRRTNCTKRCSILAPATSTIRDFNASNRSDECSQINCATPAQWTSTLWTAPTKYSDVTMHCPPLRDEGGQEVAAVRGVLS